MPKANLFQLIDLDRTLFDTSKFVKYLTESVDEVEPGLGAELDARFEESYKKEETFFVIAYLRERFGDEWYEALAARVVAVHGGDEFKLSGFDERLALAEQLTDQRPAYGVLTFGPEKDQRMKMALIGLADAPLFLTDTPDKAPLIADWRREDGTFKLPGILGGAVVDELTFEDDKLRAFQGLPAGVTGVWLHEGDAPAELPAGVVCVNSLDDSTEYLKEKYL